MKPSDKFFFGSLVIFVLAAIVNTMLEAQAAPFIILTWVLTILVYLIITRIKARDKTKWGIK